MSCPTPLPFEFHSPVRVTPTPNPKLKRRVRKVACGGDNASSPVNSVDFMGSRTTEALHWASMVLEQRLVQCRVKVSNFAWVLQLLEEAPIEESRRQAAAVRVSNSLSYALRGETGAARYELGLVNSMFAATEHTARDCTCRKTEDSPIPNHVTTKEETKSRPATLARFSTAVALSPAMIVLIPIWAICWGAYWLTRFLGSTTKDEIPIAKREGGGGSSELDERLLTGWMKEMSDFDRF
jgi:hypothetical protein